MYSYKCPKWSYPSNIPTYNQLTKSPAPQVGFRAWGTRDSGFGVYGTRTSGCKVTGASGLGFGV